MWASHPLALEVEPNYLQFHDKPNAQGLQIRIQVWALHPLGRKRLGDKLNTMSTV